jgi:hypothetical protein
MLAIAVSSVSGVTLALAAQSLGDEFDGNVLNAKWQWHLEPASWDIGVTKAGWVHIDAEPSHNLWATDGAHRFYQEIQLDQFDVETHIIADWGNTGSTVCGVMIYSATEDNWVTVKVWGRGMTNGQIQYQTKQNESGNGLTGNAPGFVVTDGGTDIYIRLVKDGDSYTGYFKTDVDGDWTVLGPTTFTLTPPLQLSLYAGVADASGEMTAGFEYFRDNINPQPVEPLGRLTTSWGQIRLGME